jgi:hypothetical protein
MRVVANAKGYFGSLREVGDEFEVPDGIKGSWFAPVAAEADTKPAGKGRRKTAEPDPAGDEAADAI